MTELEQQQSLVRLAEDKNFPELEEAWLTAVGSDADFGPCFRALKKVVDVGEPDRALTLIIAALPKLKERERWSDILASLRLVVPVTARTAALRSDILEAVKGTYRGRPGLAVAVDLSGLGGNADLRECMKKIDQWLAFGVGQHVQHDAGWGTGRVVGVDETTGELTIDFEEKSGHKIPVASAAQFLKLLPEDHIKAYKFSRMDELKRLAAETPLAVVKIVLKSLKGKATLTDLKNQLLDSVIPAKDWSKWWNRAKKEAFNDPFVAISEGARPTLTLREKGLSAADEITARMIKKQSFREEVALARQYYKQSQASSHPEVIAHMQKRLTEEWDRTLLAEPGVVVEALFCLADIGSKEAAGVAHAPIDVYDALAAQAAPGGPLSERPIVKILTSMEITEYRKRYLRLVREAHPAEWTAIYGEVVRAGLQDVWDFCVDALAADATGLPVLDAAFTAISDGYRNYPEAFALLCRDAMEDGTEAHKRHPQKLALFEKAISLMDAIDRAKGLVDKASAKPILTRLRGIVLDRDKTELHKLVTEFGKEGSARILQRIKSGRAIGEDARDRLWEGIAVKYPELLEKPKKPFWEEDLIFVTRQAMKRRQDEFANLMNVKIPENSRAIGLAAAHGDLSENGEYTAALEEQQLLIGKANRMKEELEKARFIESQEIRIDVVMPGTKVILKNLGTAKQEAYVVLGPWDADPDRSIVAYTAPIGRGLLGRKVGERATVDLPEGKAEYEVVEIEHAL